MAPRGTSSRTVLLAGLASLLYPASVLGSETHALLVRATPDNLDCQTERSTDYYGLGVRLGIYFAWLTGYVANIALPGEVAGALDTNAIFLFALMVSMIRCSMTGMLQQLDGLLLMHLSGGTIFGVLSIWGYRTCHYHVDGPKGIRHFGGFGTHMRLLLSLAISVFGLWFWLRGVENGLTADTLDPANETYCSELFTFMFAKVRANGGIRIFYIIVCAACIAYFGIMLIASALSAWGRTRKILTLIKKKQWTSTSRLRYATGLNMEELRYCFNALRVLNLFWLIYSAVMVEFTLNFNHVMGVLGQSGSVSLPSQLIPMLIGAFSFVRIMWILFEEWRSPGDTDPSVAEDLPKPTRSATLHAGIALLKVFSPSLGVDARQRVITHEDDEIDPVMDDKSRWQRYLVAWLPWLSLMKMVHGDAWESLPMTTQDMEETSGSPRASHEQDNTRQPSWGSGSTVEGSEQREKSPRLERDDS